MNEPQTQVGMIGLFESRRVILPLKAVQCVFSVAGGLAEVTITQVFFQQNRQSLDCVYQFRVSGKPGS